MEILFDPGPVAWLQETVGPAGAALLEPVSLLGISWGIILLAGLAFWLWGREVMYALWSLVVLEGVAKTALSSLLAVPRPDAPTIVAYERVTGSYAFPSGHVSTTAAMWGYPAARRLLSPIVAIVPVVLVAVSRLVLGVHYLGDVLGGMGFGLLAALVWVHLWPRLHAYLRELPFAFFVGLSAVVVAGAAAAVSFYLGDSPYRWRSAGMVVGAAVALPLEHRFVRYAPERVAAGGRAVGATVGVAGIAVALLLARWPADPGLPWRAAMTCFAAAWALLLTPALLRRLGDRGRWARGEPGDG